MLLYCHAGCDLEHVCASMGMEVTELFAQCEAVEPEGCSLAMLAHRVGIPAPILREFGMEDTEHGKHGVPCVAVPYRDVDGNVVRRKLRMSLSGKPKYLWGPGEEVIPYGLWRLPDYRAGKALVVTEGESDCWALWAEGVPAIALPGADTAGLLRREHVAWFDRAWICQDADKPGEKFCSEVGDRLLEFGIQEPRRVRPPQPYKDICDWRSALGPGAFVEALRTACRNAPRYDARAAPLLLASTLKVRAPQFTIDPYIPRGYITLLGGKPGMGKSMLTCYLVSAVTQGIPVCGAEVEGPGTCLMYSAEDELEEVIVPRLQRAGARMDRVRLRSFEEEYFALDTAGIGELEAAIAEYHPSLVVLDPLVAFLGEKLDMNASNQVRASMRPLAMLARRAKIGVLAVAHVRKGRVTEAIDSFMASLDFVATVRSALVTFHDPQRVKSDPGSRYVVAHAKQNLSAPGAALVYEIMPDPDEPKWPELVWRGQSPFSLRDLEEFEGSDRYGVIEAIELVRGRLLDGPKPLSDLRRLTRQAGLPESALRGARKALALELVEFGGEVKLQLPNLPSGPCGPP